MNNVYYGKLVFELSKPGRVGYSLPKSEISGYCISEMPDVLKRQSKTILPECDELTVVRPSFHPCGICAGQPEGL